MQQDIKILVVEDELIWQKALELHLQELGFNIVAIATSSEEALPMIIANNFDVAILDINIGGKSRGIDLGKIIHSSNAKPFIFLTGSTDSHTMEQAANAQPSAYLLKPANKVSLLVAIQNAIENYHQKQQATYTAPTDNNDFIFVKKGNNYKKIFWKSVVLLSSEGKYTQLTVEPDCQTFLVRSTMPKTYKNYLPELYKQKFLQINRAEMVNIDFIEEITQELVITKYNKLGYSESQGKELKKKLNIIS